MDYQNKQGNLPWNTIIDDSNSESTLSAEKIKEQERKKGVEAPFYIDPKIFKQNTPKEETSPGDEIVRLNLVREKNSAESYKKPASNIQNYSSEFEITEYQTPNASYQQCPQQNIPNTNTYYQQVQSENNYCSAQALANYQYYSQPVIPTCENSTKKLAEELGKTNIRLYEKQEIAKIEVRKKIALKRALNKETLRFQKEKDKYNEKHKSKIMSQNNSGSSSSINSKNSNKFISPKSIIEKFIKEKALVKIRTLGKCKRLTMIFSEDENRHIAITSQDLESEFYNFIEEKFPDKDTPPQNFIKRALNLLNSRIPKIEKSKLTILEPHQVMFINGYVDILSWKFKELSNKERRKYFTLFSFDISLEKCNYSYPDVFDKLLKDALNNNTEAIKLAYEQIGAIFTPISTLKKIFVFQGVTDGGKTRISNIIAKCMPPEDTLVLSNIAEISNDNLISRPIRLILIQELGKNKISSKQIVKLKAFADGSHLPGALSAKILANTNYAITTDENGNIEQALKNRLSITPFPKSMDNIDDDVSSFEDCYFEKEKLGIILKALLIFSEAFHNKKFSHKFKPNLYVHNEESQKRTSLDEEFSNNNTLSNEITKTNQNQLEQIMNELFEFTNEINPDMTIKSIVKIVNHCIPNEFKDESSAGRRIHKIFGDKIKSDRINGKTCYNLKLKTNPTDN